MVNSVAQALYQWGNFSPFWEFPWEFPRNKVDTGRQSTPFHVAGMCSVLFNLMMIFIACFIFNNVA
jgi:hypothetical protein